MAASSPNCPRVGRNSSSFQYKLIRPVRLRAGHSGCGAKKGRLQAIEPILSEKANAAVQFLFGGNREG
jgi:hypothetical protein